LLIAACADSTTPGRAPAPAAPAFASTGSPATREATRTYQEKGSTGIGATTGAEYRVREALSEHFQVRGAEYPAVYTATFTRHFISPGSAPNFRVHNVNHFRLDADGGLTVEFGHSVRQCT
jgi:hypothetical protein